MSGKISGVLCLVIALFISCRTTAVEDPNTIRRASGNVLGSVSASAAISENRDTGEVSGDTLKYGYILNAAPKSSTEALKKIDAVTSPAMEKARANAIYDIIAQVRKLGGNAVTDVVSQTFREYDPDTRIETVRVMVTASAVKADKKGGN